MIFCAGSTQSHLERYLGEEFWAKAKFGSHEHIFVIIVFLAAVGIPAYDGYISDARDKAAQATLQSIVLQQKNYYQDNFCYVTTGTGTDVGPAINKHLFGSSDAESTMTPIDTTASNFFYFEIKFIYIFKYFYKSVLQNIICIVVRYYNFPYVPIEIFFVTLY